MQNSHFQIIKTYLQNRNHYNLFSMQLSFQIFCIHFMKSFLKIFTFVIANFIFSKWFDFENLLISFEIIAICFQCNHHFKYFAFISWNHFWKSSRSWLQISFSRNDSILKFIDLVRNHCNLFSMQSSFQIFCTHFMKSFLKIFTFVTANFTLSKWFDFEHLLISFEISFENIAICFQYNHHFKYFAFISWDHFWKFSRSWLQISFFRNDSISKIYWSRSKSLQFAFNAIIISNILHSFHEIILGNFHVRDCMIYTLEMIRFWTFVDIVRNLVRKHCNLLSIQSLSRIFCIHFMRSF